MLSGNRGEGQHCGHTSKGHLVGDHRTQEPRGGGVQTHGPFEVWRVQTQGAMRKGLDDHAILSGPLSASGSVVETIFGRH